MRNNITTTDSISVTIELDKPYVSIVEFTALRVVFKLRSLFVLIKQQVILEYFIGENV